MKTPFAKYPIGLLMFLFLTFSVCHAQIDLQKQIPVDPAVKTGTLENGLRYYIRKNAKPENKVELRLVVNAGSILEDDDQRGLAHFTEHMAFNGSRNFKKNDIVSFLQSIGVEFGADLNAYTSFDETVYILPIPTEKKENVEKGFQILEDWASTIAFEGSEIDKERGVVLEESRLGKGADDRMEKITYPRIFAGSKYADRLPIGQDEILKNFKYETLKRFYSDWYRPDLMAVIVVGDIEPAEAGQYVKKHFQHLKNPSNPRPRTYAGVPPRERSEGIVATDKEATNPILRIYYSNERVKPETTLGDLRYSVVRRLMTSMLGQRLQELTQKAEPPFIFGGSALSGFVRGYEGYSSFALLSKGGAQPAIAAIVQENERARKFGFTEAEFDRTRKMMMKSVERAYNERDKTESARLAEEYIRNFLVSEPIPGIENEFNYYRDFLDGIKLAEINELAASIIPPVNAHKLIVYTGPEKADFPTPTNEGLVQMVEDAARIEVKPFAEKTIASTLIEKVPQEGEITAESINRELGITEITFGNGVKVILKPTDFKNDQVVMAATRFGGQYLFDPADRYSAEYASVVVSQMGVGQFSPVDLRKVLAGKNVSVAPRISSTSESLNGQCSAADVEAMLQLTYLYFTQPRHDPELFTSFVTRQQALYQNMTSDPQYAFQDSLLNILYRDHPWAPRVPRAETFTKVDAEKVMRIYKERFGHANGFTFVFVGKFDTDAVKPLLATYLGSLPFNDVQSTYRDVGLRPAKGPLKKEIIKGTEQKSFIRLFWNGETSYSSDEHLKLQALTELMNIKITETLREDLSGIYGGGMYGVMNKYPYQNYSIGLAFPCGPENVDRLIGAALAEIEKVKTHGPLKEDLDKVKETWKQQYLVNIQDNGYWARQLIQSIEMESDPGNILTYEKRVEALTVGDLKTVAAKYLDTKNYIQVILNPEE